MGDKSYVGLTTCWYCLGPGALLIDTRLRETFPSGQLGVWDMTPCSECEEHMKQGVILISVRDGEEDKVEEERREHEDHLRRQGNFGPRERAARPFIPNPYRTGGWVLVRDELISRNLDEACAAQILRCRFALVPDSAWNRFGLPWGEVSMLPGPAAGAGE